jgi:4'-phosphopantetheinyl transferase
MRRMESDVVDVWLISCDGAGDLGAYNVLSEEERKRAQDFMFPEHRQRFVRAHVCLRQILHRYTAVPPDALRFGCGESGKPFLENGGGPFPLSFNLSHSAHLAVVAVAAVSEIGVDVEQIRPLPDWEEIARSSFHPAEMEWVGAAAADRRTEAFFQVWTAKEAYIKASGQGLARPLDSFAVVGVAPQQEYVVSRLELPPGYAGALAHPPPACGIRQRWWRDGQDPSRTVAR